MKNLLGGGLCCACLLLVACDGNNQQDPTPAPVSVAPIEQTAGDTPFISTLSIALDRYADLTNAAFTITPKPGTFSRPVFITYDKTWLDRNGAYQPGNQRITLPVFGLYANYSNEVRVIFKFGDGSMRMERVIVQTPAISVQDSVYGAPDIKAARGAQSAPGFDYMLVRNRITSPVVIDTDGNVRWIASGFNDSLSTILVENGFYIGSSTAPTLTRLELDGTSASKTLASSKFTNFHHDITPGKVGLLAELDVLENGVKKIEQVLAEISPTGEILKEWDMAAIFRKAMLAGGDDPANFVRPQVDWFHMNSAIYSPADNSLIVSSRESFIVKLDYDTGKIKWIFGDPGKHWYVDYPSLRALALKLTSGKPPVGQHSLSLTSKGQLLVFNNGLASLSQPPGTSLGNNLPYSGPSLYAIDEKKRTAAEVWTYRHPPDIYSDVCSSVREVTPGRYLIAYAMADERTRAKLVGVDAAGDVAFDFEYPTSLCRTVFAAQPIGFEAMELK